MSRSEEDNKKSENETINIEPAIINCLQSRFGFAEFRPMQWKIISSVIHGKRDNLAIMTTGYGKSLCFQFPSVYLETTSIVVSPLISLMEDQVHALTILNIKACFLGSAQADKSIYGDVLNGKYQMVYVTPELLESNFGSNLLQTLKPRLTLIAIDEAHCISKWGHDFRSAFLWLGGIREILPRVPILAVTATATEQVRKDIVSLLKLRNPQVLCTGFDRPNLEFNVQMKSQQGIWSDIGKLVLLEQTGSIIIYCLTRNQTEDIAAVLKERKVNCAAYHAGLSVSRRRTVHEDFAHDRIRVIVATIAFGMGIDKPDVRQIIHYGASKDIESYYQEIGRAGRDGLPAKCNMFYSLGDFQMHRNFHAKNSAEFQHHTDHLSSKMRTYVNTTDCRRRFILQYFEGKQLEVKPRKDCCDNCRESLNSENQCTKYEGVDENGCYDFSLDAKLLLEAVNVFGGRTGLVTPISFLHGSKSKLINERYYTHSLHGKGKSKSIDWWKSVASLLEQHDFLVRQDVQSTQKTFRRMQIINLTNSAKQWLCRNDAKLVLKLPKDMYRFLKVKQATRDSDKNHQAGTSRKLLDIRPIAARATNERAELMKSLMLLRNSLAVQLDVMPYALCSNRVIEQLAEIQPMNLDEMRKIQLDGFPESKIAKFGSQFIECILRFKNFLPNATNKFSSSLQDFLHIHPIPGSRINPTHYTTLELWKSGKYIQEIAQLRAFTESTIGSHLCELIKFGFLDLADLRRLDVNKTTLEVIRSVLNTVDDIMNIKLTPIKEKCPASLTWNQFKFAVSYLQLEYHLKANNVNIELFKEAKDTESETNKVTSLTAETGSITAAISNNAIPVDKYFDSDDDFDLSLIDMPSTNPSSCEGVLHQNNTSVTTVIDMDTDSECSKNVINAQEQIKVASTVDEQLDPEHSCDTEDDLDKLILLIKEDEIDNQQTQNIKNADEDSHIDVNDLKENISVKRKLSLKRQTSAPKKILFMEDSSSSADSDDESTQKLSLPKSQPTWLLKKSTSTAQRKVNVLNLNDL